MKKFNMLKNMTLKMGLGLTVVITAGAGAIALPTSTFAATTTSNSIADNIISTAKQYMGTPYHFGSKTGNTSTFDCSSFTQYVFEKNGISIPRDSRQQSQVGTYVSRDQLQPGDLVFFYSPIHHVAIYIGNGQIIHDYGSPGVTISNLNSGWWSSHYTTARRVIPNNGQAVAPVAQNNNNQPAQTGSANNTSNAVVSKPLQTSHAISNQPSGTKSTKIKKKVHHRHHSHHRLSQVYRYTQE